jgi:hypothetical protein
MSASPYYLIPTSTTQAKRLALLYGPGHCWKAPQTYGLSYPARFDIPRLKLTLRLLARRHSALRTFFLDNGSIDVAGCLPAEEATWPLRVVMPAGQANVTAHQDDAFAWLQRDFHPFERPLMRALLLRRDDDDLLGLSIDHCILDGFSSRLLLTDLARAYESLAAGPAADLDLLKSDAVQFARDERAWLDSAEGAAALAYWDRHNEGIGGYPLLDLPENAPFDPAEPMVFYPVRYSPERVARFRERASGLRISSFMLAAAAVAASLREHSRSDQVAFLFSNARRSWQSTQSLVAYVANRSMVRLMVTPEDSVATLACQVRAGVLEALRHEMLCHEQYLRIRAADLYDTRPDVPALVLNVMEQKPLPTIGGVPFSLVSLPDRPGGYSTPGYSVNLILGSDGTGTLVGIQPRGMYCESLVKEVTHAIAKHAGLE